MKLIMLKGGEIPLKETEGEKERWFRVNEGMRAHGRSVRRFIDEAAETPIESVEEICTSLALEHNQRLVDLQDEADSLGIYFSYDDEEHMREN